MKRSIGPPQAGKGTVRINRYLSMCGIASRRKAEELILEGKVKVNGAVRSDLGTQINLERDTVVIAGKKVSFVPDYLYLVMNKPKDAITTLSDERGRTTVMSMIRSRQRVFPIGRLDRNTTGVLLFTNDGEFAHHLMHPKFGIPKSYRVTCSKAVAAAHLAMLRKGVTLADGTTGTADVYALPGGRGKEIGIVIREGRNRQVRRMFETLGYDVTKLDRVAYGPITHEGLARGGTRSLSRAEVRALKSLAGIVEDAGAIPAAGRR